MESSIANTTWNIFLLSHVMCPSRDTGYHYTICLINICPLVQTLPRVGAGRLTGVLEAFLLTAGCTVISILSGWTHGVLAILQGGIWIET